MPEYQLQGTTTHPQVSPDASYWLRCKFLKTVPLDDVRRRVEGNEDSNKNVQPHYQNGTPEAEAELDELYEFFKKRDWRRYFAKRQADFPDRERLSNFLVNEKYIRPWPAGSVLNRRGSVANRLPGLPIIQTGAELARLFESETPGLWHRHVLNVLLDPSVDGGLGTKLSPPRQALIWAALDVAIVSALSAVWFYKWIGPDGISRRPRPQEARSGLEVLFDYKVAYNSRGDVRRRLAKSNDPPTQPGSPRHPAYGSGHSTYSAAASRVLGCLIPSHAEDFRLLAENIGHARLWGGVHWRSDHEAGMLIGNAVGDLVIEQLNQSGIEVAPEAELPPTPIKDLRDRSDAFSKACGSGTEQFCGKSQALDLVIQNRSSLPAFDEPVDEEEDIEPDE